MPQKTRIPIYPICPELISLCKQSKGQIKFQIIDHINLRGSSPKNIGFIPITDLYVKEVPDKDTHAIKVICIQEGETLTESQTQILLEQGVKAYTHKLIPESLYAAAEGKQVLAQGFYPRSFEGIKFQSYTAGIKDSGNKDLGLINSDTELLWAGTFTQNQVKATCVSSNQKSLNKKVRAVFINSGNANCCTGPKGEQNDQEIRSKLASALKSSPEQILTASTGVIGVQLEMDKINPGLESLSQEASNAQSFAKAMLTTDTCSKIYQDEGNKMLAFAKGSGMIAPNMATMLAFIVTDSRIEGLKNDQELQSFMQDCLQEAVQESFNSISVDSDTSTNDMVLLLNSCRGDLISQDDFRSTVKETCLNLAKQIIADGEGLTKIIEVSIKNFKNCYLAHKLGKNIVNSPLVKTAIHGNDPNWGRILMALGKDSEEELDLSNIEISILGQKVYTNGMPSEFIQNTENRDKLSQSMKQCHNIRIDIEDVASNESNEVLLWGNDLSYDYIKINADYTS